LRSSIFRNHRSLSAARPTSHTHLSISPSLFFHSFTHSFLTPQLPHHRPIYQFFNRNLQALLRSQYSAQSDNNPTMTNPHVKLKIAIVLLSSLFFVGPANAFFRHLCHGELGNGRIDPIVAPGNPSQHLHVIFGASSEFDHRSRQKEKLTRSQIWDLSQPLKNFWRLTARAAPSCKTTLPTGLRVCTSSTAMALSK
jgi:hypothetical protein